MPDLLSLKLVMYSNTDNWNPASDLMFKGDNTDRFIMA